MKSHFRVLIGGVIAAAPLGILLPGCSGGSGNSFLSPSSTPSPTATATAVPTSTAVAPTTSNLTLQNGQRAILKTTTSGTTLSGTIQILAPLATARKAAAFSFSIPVGTYGIVSGTFTPPRGYDFTGNFGTLGNFHMSGQLPTQTQTGSYSLTVNGQTETGTIPKIGDPLPTPQPTPSVTSTPVPGGTATSNLTFAKSSDSNFKGGPSTGLIVYSSPLNAVIATATGSDNSAGNAFSIVLPFLTAQTGSSKKLVDLAPSGISSGTYIISIANNSTPLYFAPTSGTVTLTAYNGKTATLTMKDAVYTANPGSAAKGKVTVNGTISGPLKIQ